MGNILVLKMHFFEQVNFVRWLLYIRTTRSALKLLILGDVDEVKARVGGKGVFMSRCLLLILLDRGVHLENSVGRQLNAAFHDLTSQRIHKLNEAKVLAQHQCVL
jgi:hypothetical protein